MGIAMAVGTAIHFVLENVDLEADPADARARADALLQMALGEAAAPERFEAVLARAGALLERITEGTLYAKLRGLAPQIVARELPVLVPPDDDTGPAAYLSGTIDLVYRDADSGQLVVADYKTDRVDDDVVLQERTAAYALQGAVYQRAVQEAFGLPYTPRFELWYLAADRIVQAPGNGAGPARPEVHRQ
jgi:ATP-dependent exoDNAse (exonuclease V) beta subunit